MFSLRPVKRLSAQALFQYFAGHSAVVDHQNFQTVENLRAGWMRPASSTELSREVERAFWAQSALAPDSPIHHFGDLMSDRQAEAGSAVLSRRGSVGLSKRVEDRGNRLWADFNARVRDFEVKCDSLVCLFLDGKFESDLEAATFDPGEVQHVADNRQQVIGR